MSLLARVSLRRLILGAAVVIAVAGSAGIVGVLALTELSGRELQRALEAFAEDEAIADRIVGDVYAQAALATGYARTGERAPAGTFRRRADRIYEDIRSYLRRDLRPAERRQVERVKSAYERLDVLAHDAFLGGADLDIERFERAIFREAAELHQSVRRLVALRSQANRRIVERQQRIAGRLLIGAVAMVIAFLFVLGFLTYILRRRLVEPLDALAASVRRLGEGGPPVQVPVPARDALGAVAESFNTMAERVATARMDRERAQRRLRELVESLNVVVWEADPETLRLSFVSRRAEEMFGLPLSDLARDDDWFRVIHPHDRGRVRAALRALAEDDDVREIECRAVSRAGRTLWVRVLVRLTRDEDGTTRRLRGTISDITDRRGAKEELRRSEARYRALFDGVPVGIYRSAPDGTLLDVNRAMVRMFGYPDRESLLEQPAQRLYADAEARRHWAERIEAREDDFEEAILPVRRRDGTSFRVRDRSKIVRGADGEVLYYEGVLEDVSGRLEAEEALRESEALFRSLVEHGVEGVKILERDGTLRYRSPAAERILGYEPDDPAPRGWHELLHPDDQSKVEREFGALVAAAPKTRKVLRYRARHRDGSWRMLEATGQNLLDDPYIRGVVVHMVDVTERDRLADQLMHAQKMEAIGTLAGGIAHDFNNLLTAITGNVQLLRGGGDVPDSIATELDEIEHAAGRAAELTQQLLTFSRGQVTHAETVDLSECVAETTGMLGRVLGEDLQLDTRLRDGAWVEADATQMEQVLLNLALNARDAMPTGGTLTIATRIELVDADPADARPLDPGSYVVLTVADTGPGIPPDLLPHIFEPFFTTKSSGAGSGLGLAMVYGIVQESGGQVFARNRPEGGAEFEIYLPRTSVPEDAEPPEEPERSPRGRSGRILLVEDDAAVRLLVRRTLSRSGYEVLEAADGEQALSLLRDGGIDLMLTDVVMPGMSGPELARRVADEWPEIRVLFMTGYAQDALERRGLGSRGAQLIKKPFTPTRLATAVEDVLAAEPGLADAPDHEPGIEG